MPQEIDWDDDSQWTSGYSSGDSMWDDDSQWEPVKPKFSWFDFLGSSTDVGPSTPSKGLYNPGTYAPGEAHAPPDYMDYSKPDPFFKGMRDVPTEIYNYVDELGRKGAQQIGEGNYAEAFNTVTSPVYGPFQGLMDMGARKLSGKPAMDLPEDPTERKWMAAQPALDLLGFPQQSFREAWEQEDVPRLAGQAAGAVLGFQGLRKVGEARKPNAPPEAGPMYGPEPPTFGPEVPEGFNPRKNEWLEKQHPQPIHGPEIGPYGTGEGQPSLDFGSYRGQRGQFTRTGPGVAPKLGPEVGELPIQQGAGAQPVSFDEPFTQPSLPEAPPPADVSPMWQQPEPPKVSDDRTVITIKNPVMSEVRRLLGEGFVAMGQRGPNNEVQLVRGDVAPQVLTGDKQLPEPSPIVEPQPVAGAARPGIQSNPDGSVLVPNELVTEEFILGRQDDGFDKTGQNETHTLFERVREAVTSEEGSLDPQALWENLKRMLGRDPTPQEVQTATQREAGPTEQRGRIAPFASPTEVPREGAMTIPSEPQLGDPLPDFPRDRFGNRIMNTGGVPPGEATRQHYERTRGQFDLSDQANMDSMPGPDDPMWSDARPPTVRVPPDMDWMRPHDPPPQQGQLMPMEVGPQQGLSNQDMMGLRTPQVMGNEPVQQSMDFGKTGPENLLPSKQRRDVAERAELDAYLQSGGNTPPEAQTTGITQKIQQTTTDLLKGVFSDESGTLDIPALLRRIREFAGRADEVDDVAPRQRENDQSELNRAQTVEEVRLIRDAWRDRVSLMGDRELRSPIGQHATAMQQAARERVRTMLDAEQAAVLESYSGNAPVIRQSTIGQQADIREIDNIGTARRASETLEFWEREVERDRATGDPDLAHSEDMLRRVRQRLLELDPDGTIVPAVHVFNPITGRDVRTFFSEVDAQAYIDAHPNESLDLETAGDTPRQQPQGQFEVVEGQFEVVDVDTGEIVLEGLTEDDASAFVVRRGREDPTVALGYRAMGSWVPEQQTPLPPANTIPPDYGNQPFNAPRLVNARRTPRVSPTSADIPGEFGVYDYSDLDSRGNPIRIAGFATRTEAEAHVRTLPNRYDYDVIRSSIQDGAAAASSANAPVTSTPTHDPYFGPEPATPAEIRAATGDLMPPVKLGLQPKRTEITTLNEAQIKRLEMGADPGVLKKVREAQQKRKEWKEQNREENKQRRLRGEPPLTPPRDILDDKGWNTWGADQRNRLPLTGDPGLTIARDNYGRGYDIIYRAPDQRVIGYAHVSEHPGEPYGSPNFRYVPTLAVDMSTAGLGGRAFNAIGGALKDMNALDAGGGYISQFTGRAIANLLARFKEDAGYLDISRMTEMLKVAAKLSKKYGADAKSNIMDVYADLAKHFEGVDIKWIADKYKNSRLSSETGAINLPRTAGGAIDLGKGINQAVDFVKDKTGWGKGESYKAKPDELNLIKEAMSLPSSTTTTLDASAPGRQGLSLIATPEFWGAATRMFGALHYDTWKKMDAELRKNELMVRPVDPVTGKQGKSMGDLIGTKMFSPASEPGPRAEATASRWLEMGIGKRVQVGQKLEWQPTIGSKLWQHSAGYPIRASNRMFIHFLNHLNVNRTKKLMDLARDQAIKGITTGRTAMPGILGGVHLPSSVGIPFTDKRIPTGFEPGSNIGFTKKVTPDEALDINPYHNLVRGKEIADFVNTATGHGPLKTHILPYKKAEISLESATDKLGYVFFSPKLLASRIRMMNPNTYIMASPFARKQYLKAGLSSAAMWFITSQMLKKAAGDEAEVNYDPTSADFGKVRIGDARLDISGGFSQFAVAYSRLYVGGSTSSATGEFHRFGSGYQAQTSEDMMERFLVNKLNPVTKFAYDVASASEYKPFHVGDRTMQLFVPLIAQDLYEIGKENPDLLPMFGGAAMFGGGTQIYSKGESVGKFIEPENDWLVTGGGVRDVMPWNWGVDPGEESNLPRVFPWSDELR